VEELHLSAGEVVRAADGVGDLEIFGFYGHQFSPRTSFTLSWQCSQPQVPHSWHSKHSFSQ